MVLTTAMRDVCVRKAPPVLTIHLKRFHQDMRGRLSKISTHVDFDDTFKLEVLEEVPPPKISAWSRKGSVRFGKTSAGEASVSHAVCFWELAQVPRWFSFMLVCLGS